ncbi:MAG TPA: hypothetical protein PKY31_00860 [Spirochaetota bacterium]|nr:hypothetical protein [Spirochaetota bacterium]
MVPVQLVLIIIVNVVTIISAYWIMQKKTGEKLVLHQEKIRNMECDVEKIDELVTEVALLKQQVGTFRGSIDTLTTIVNNLTKEIISLRKSNNRKSRKGNG